MLDYWRVNPSAANSRYQSVLNKKVYTTKLKGNLQILTVFNRENRCHVAFGKEIQIWLFPKIGVPLNHPF